MMKILKKLSHIWPILVFLLYFVPIFIFVPFITILGLLTSSVLPVIESLANVITTHMMTILFVETIFVVSFSILGLFIKNFSDKNTEES